MPSVDRTRRDACRRNMAGPEGGGLDFRRQREILYRSLIAGGEAMNVGNKDIEIATIF